MVHIARGLAECGHCVDLVLSKAEGPYLEAVPSDVRLVNLGARRLLTSLPGLVRYLRRERPDAVLSALTQANIVALWARRLARVDTCVVVSEHSTFSIAAANPRNRRSRLLPHLARYFYPWADSIIAVSEGAADDLAATLRIDRQRIHVVYNPVVTPELAHLAREPVDHPWFSGGGPPVILGVGRLTKPKDFPTLVRAFAMVRQQREARLVILGEGEDRPQLEQLVQQLALEQNVSLPGFVDNPYSYMARARVFALSSRWEGFGNVLVEAMACGTPVVSTDCPHGPREILEDGRWGKLVPVGNPQALASSILDTLSKPPDQQGPRQRASSFTIDSAIDKYLNILQSLSPASSQMSMEISDGWANQL
jgi:glycosyltransferase involved in cell wall biosynthesis